MLDQSLNAGYITILKKEIQNLADDDLYTEQGKNKFWSFNSSFIFLASDLESCKFHIF